MTPRIVLYKGTNLLDKAIEWQTRSDYSHACILINPNEVVESAPGKGVQHRIVSDDELATCDQFLVPDMTDDQWNIALKFIEGEMGCGYDWLGDFRFITRQPGGDPNRWFCSELVFAALAQADYYLLRNIEAWAVSPALIGLSPLIIPMNPDNNKKIFIRSKIVLEVKVPLSIHNHVNTLVSKIHTDVRSSIL